MYFVNDFVLVLLFKIFYWVDKYFVKVDLNNILFEKVNWEMWLVVCFFIGYMCKLWVLMYIDVLCFCCKLLFLIIMYVEWYEWSCYVWLNLKYVFIILFVLILVVVVIFCVNMVILCIFIGLVIKIIYVVWCVGWLFVVLFCVVWNWCGCVMWWMYCYRVVFDVFIVLGRLFVEM